jgi:phosphate transport system permease protein
MSTVTDLTDVIAAPDVDAVTDLDDGSARDVTLVMPAVEGTTLPRVAAGPAAVKPRSIARIGKQGVMLVAGAGVSALSMTALLFGRLTPMSGRIGFTVVGFALFVVIYAVLASLTDNTPAVIDRVMTVLMTAAAVLAIVALGSVIVSTLRKGSEALFNPNFFVEDMSTTGPLDPLSMGGIAHAIVGTLMMTAISLVLTVPVAIACAVFLNESKGRMATLVRTIVTAMTALPSILAGLFILATWIVILGFERSGFAASLAVSIMMLPIIIRSADVVLRLVPGGLREASAALGAPQWRTVWHVVLPTARSGLTTSVILGVARGIGETAPVLLTAGLATAMNVNPFSSPMVSLPLAAFQMVKSPQETMIARGFATAAVLMVVVLVLFVIARILGGRPAGRLSKRQVRRATARSAEDLRRSELRHRTNNHLEVQS